jgi:hypothetical protein
LLSQRDAGDIYGTEQGPDCDSGRSLNVVIEGA